MVGFDINHRHAGFLDRHTDTVTKQGVKLLFKIHSSLKKNHNTLQSPHLN